MQFCTQVGFGGLVAWLNCRLTKKVLQEIIWGMQSKKIMNREQGTLAIYLPRPMLVAEFRETFSLWIDESHLPAGLTAVQACALFNHAEDGKPLNDLSPYRFQVDGNWGLVHAIGASACAVLRKFGQLAPDGPMSMGMAKAKFEERNVGCLLVDAPASYVIPEMVVCRNARQYARWRSAPCGDKRQYLQQCLQKALQRQADFLGITLQVQQPEIICFGQERTIPKVRRSPANAFLRVASVEFALPLVLHGHWAAGALINRGFGVIFDGKNVEQP